MLSASKSGSGLATGYNLTRSLRFRASASAYLNRTFTTPTSSTIYTWSSWVKRGTLSTTQYLFGASTTTNFGFNSSNNLIVTLNGTTAATTTAVYRDPSSWYHVVYVQNGSAQTIYVNNISVATGTTANTVFNTAIAHQLAAANTTNYFDGYLAETNFIDGQALTPSSFGSANALTGVWQPAAYTGSYGTNGFYLPFTDNSALTTSSNVGLGKDFSGNGNYWTTNNISITAGVTYDSMTDVPTLTSATASNFPIFNPLQPHDGGYTTSVTNGNMAVAITYNSGGNMVTVPSTIKTSPSGKWYWEVNVTSALAGGTTGIGVITPDSYVESTVPPTNNYLYVQNGNKFTNGTATAYGATFTSGDYIGVALDVGAGTITFYKNNVSQGVAFTGLTATSYYAVVTSNATGTRSYAINFGQQPFQYTPPTGFIALNGYNLPDSTIVKGNTVMDATLYTGTLLSNAITNAASFKPDLVWVKSRSAATDNKLTDSVRGVTKGLVSNTTAAETTDTQGLTAFNTNGFTVGTNTDYNNLAATYVAWQWQAGQGSSSSNTNGTITSTVSVNASAGFSVVTYTGTGANATIGHGLGVAPSLIITKDRSSGSFNWGVYHASVGNTGYLQLNTTAAVTTIGIWQNTTPTSSVFYVGNYNPVNQTGDAYVAYCWTPIAGFSAFGSYTGNGSATGPFVYTGFQPKFILIKSTTAARDWIIWDTARNTFNIGTAGVLYPDTSGVEYSGGGAYAVAVTSNGFYLPVSTTNLNASGETHIYAAFASNPFKNSLAF